MKCPLFIGNKACTIARKKPKKKKNSICVQFFQIFRPPILICQSQTSIIMLWRLLHALIKRPRTRTRLLFIWSNSLTKLASKQVSWKFNYNTLNNQQKSKLILKQFHSYCWSEQHNYPLIDTYLFRTFIRPMFHKQIAYHGITPFLCI